MTNSSSLNLFGEEHSLPPFQRSSATSRAAAEVVASSAPTQRVRVLENLRVPATDDEGASRLDMSLNSYRARRVELFKAGLVVRVGTGKSAGGNPAAIWQATSATRARREEPGLPPELWQAAVDRRPSWMSKRQHQELITEALAANRGDVRRALEQVADDLEKLR